MDEIGMLRLGLRGGGCRLVSIWWRRGRSWRLSFYCARSSDRDMGAIRIIGDEEERILAEKALGSARV